MLDCKFELDEFHKPNERQVKYGIHFGVKLVNRHRKWYCWEVWEVFLCLSNLTCTDVVVVMIGEDIGAVIYPEEGMTENILS